MNPMGIHKCSSDKTTASGGADAPALGTQSVIDKWITGQIKQLKFTPETQIFFGTWSVRTGHHAGQKEVIAMELVKH